MCLFNNIIVAIIILLLEDIQIKMINYLERNMACKKRGKI